MFEDPNVVSGVNLASFYHLLDIIHNYKQLIN